MTLSNSELNGYNKERFDRLSEHQIEATEALIAFANHVGDGKVSVEQLKEALLLAVADGWDTLIIAVGMAGLALQLCGEEQKKREERI